MLKKEIRISGQFSTVTSGFVTDPLQPLSLCLYGPAVFGSTYSKSKEKRPVCYANH